ncbi:MAG: HipA N-terminal domain-containing protein [Legionella sp.]|nr:HipA N-terminal domain-containing protein [Legionella sp.]
MHRFDNWGETWRIIFVDVCKLYQILIQIENRIILIAYGPDNQQIRARIQAKFKVPTDQPFDLLASIGRDCVGAIQIIQGEVPDFKKNWKTELMLLTSMFCFA